MPKIGITTVCDDYIFSFIRNHQTIFQRGCTILLSHQQDMHGCFSTSSPAFAIIFFFFLNFACQAPLSMGILQARILDWVVMPWDWTQGSNPGLPNCRRLLYLLSHLSYSNRWCWTFFHILICHPYILFSLKSFYIFYKLSTWIFLVLLLN